MLREILENSVNSVNEKKGDVIKRFVKQYFEDLVEYDETFSNYVYEYFTNGDYELANYRKEAKVPDDVPDNVIIGDLERAVSDEIWKTLKKL